MNFHNVHLVFPMKIKKSTNNATNFDVTLMTVNNFFAHRIKKTDIKWYDAKIWRRWCIKNISTSFVIFEKKVELPTGKDRRSHYTTNDALAGKITDDNLDDRIDKLADQL